MKDAIILLLMIAILFYFLCRFSVFERVLPTPRWSSKYEFYSYFTPTENITLQFQYDYSLLSYSLNQLKFYVGLWECSSDICPAITGNPELSQPFNPKPLQIQSFDGDDESYIQSISNRDVIYTIYDSPASEWKPGTYVIYVISTLKDASVRSSSSTPVYITIEAPGPVTPDPHLGAGLRAITNRARYVRLLSAGTPGIICIRKIVIDTTTYSINSGNSDVYASSVSGSSAPSSVLSGNSVSFFMSQKENRPWIEIDLRKVYTVVKVTIYPSEECPTGRMGGSQIVLYDDEGYIVYQSNSFPLFDYSHSYSDSTPGFAVYFVKPPSTSVYTG